MPTLVNGSWRGALGIGGLNAIVEAIALSGNDVYVGGGFQVAGRAYTWSVARFDGATWHELGEGANGSVNALAVGPTGLLYAGGLFGTIGGIAAQGIAVWDGTAWSALGDGIPYAVSSIAVDPAGNVYVAGYNTIATLSPFRLMRWDGTAWTQLGNWLGDVLRLSYDAAMGVLYAGGTFTQVDGVAASCIARWDGTAWAALGPGLNGMVLALAPDGAGALYAGGSFTASGVTALKHIAKWNSATGAWSDLGDGPDNAVKAIVIKNGLLHVGGDFGHVGTYPAVQEVDYYAVCRPRFKTWFPMGSFDSSVIALALHPSGTIYAAGSFDRVQDVVAHKVAKWDGSVWSALGASESVSDGVWVLASDAAGNTYMTGDFGWAGVQRAHVAKWNGSVWEAIHVPGASYIGGSRALALDALNRPHIARRGMYSVVSRFSGSGTMVTIQDVGHALDGEILTLAFDQAGSLFVGGNFPSAITPITGSPYPANSLARWDGSQYVPVGGGVDNCVEAIAFDAGGDMYVGGFFMKAGGVPVGMVARWDGTAWSSLQGGVDGPVYAVALGPTGALYVGGLFTTAGGVPVSNIARWNGVRWTALGSGVDGLVCSIVVDAAEVVVVCGRFKNAGGAPARHVARWDGAWSPLGSGLNGQPVALVLDSVGNLAAGGLFSQADGKDSCCFAFYTATPVTVSTNPPGAGPAAPPGPPPKEPAAYPDWWLNLISTLVHRLSKWVTLAAARWR